MSGGKNLLTEGKKVFKEKRWKRKLELYEEGKGKCKIVLKKALKEECIQEMEECI